MALRFRGSSLRRVLAPVCALAAMLLSTSCGTDTTGTDNGGLASVQVFPTFKSAAFSPITLDRVEALVERVTPDSSGEGSTRETLLQTSRSFRASDDELRLSLQVPIKERSEVVLVTISMYAGTQLLFVGSDQVEVSTGGTANPEPLGMSYVGPGNNAVGLIIEPFDTTVTAGSVTPFRATAIDGQENDVGPFYMRWSVSSTANGARIDAAGNLRAPTQAGAIWVVGNLPNGVDDSVLVTVTGAPGSITKVSGDHQSAGVNNALPERLVVAVTTSTGAPVAGVSVNWAATVGGGQMDEDVTVTDGEGIASNIAIIGENPGINIFTATVPGVGSVSFSANESQTGATVAWIGNTSSVWSNGANWSGGAAPGVLDSVVITAGGEFSPVLDTTPIVGALTLGGNNSLTLASHGLVIVRNLTLLGDAYLDMTTPNDVITVGGNALFEGGDSEGHLTNGIISIAGNFTQRSTNSGRSFAATGAHIVSMGGTNVTVSFATPGINSNQSSFQDFAWSTTGTLTLNSDVVARGTAFVGFGGNSTITSSGGFNISAAQLATSNQIPVVFNNVTVALSDTAVTSDLIGLITFQNMPTNRPQLKLRYPGGTMTLTGFTFSTTPVAPNGYYLEADDNQVGDGNNFTVQVSSTTPSSGGSFVHATNGAVVQWPPPPPP